MWPCHKQGGNQVRNMGLGGHTCLDSPARRSDLHKPVGLYPCHRQGGNQVCSTFLSNEKDESCCLHGLRFNKPTPTQLGNICTQAVAIANKWSRKCVDSPNKPDDLEQPVGLWPCHKQGGNQ
ncbi:hypothetical protein J437_LFUL002614, partial [Ladona fulva]